MVEQLKSIENKFNIMEFDIHKSIEQKEIIQNEAVDMLYDYRKILLSWATGCGKTLASLKMIKELYSHKPEIRGYIICKERGHLSSWQDDIARHKMGFIDKICDKFLYASLHKYSNKGIVDFVILDECHAVTEARAKHLKSIIGPKTIVILLSATVDIDKTIVLKSLLYGYKEFHISVDSAISRGILPVPKVYVHYMHMNDSEKAKYDEVSTKVEALQRKYEVEPSEELKFKILKAGIKRKRKMVSLKTNFARRIIHDYMKDSRYICFTGSKAQCNILGRNNIVHSDIDSKKIIRKKKDFNEGKIDNLYVVNMFREAVNLTNIEKGLIVQLDNVKLSFVQMLGRVFRSSLPEMHIIVLKDTQDEVYLNNVMKGFNAEYLQIINHQKHNNEKTKENNNYKNINKR